MSAGARLVALTVLLAGVVALWRTVDPADDVERQMWGLNRAHGVELRQKLKARPDPQISAFLPFMKLDFSDPPEAAPLGGWYAGLLHVTLRTKTGQRIHYTLDGSIPTRRSPRYEAPIEIRATTVVRYRAFAHRKFGSDTETQTYFVGEQGTLPRVSLVADPISLWNKYSGIYDNSWGRGRTWERAGHVEFAPRGGGVLRLAVRLRVHGNVSRRMQKKPFRIYYDGGDETGNAKSAVLSGRKGAVSAIFRQGGSNREYRLHDELLSVIYAGIGGLASRHEPVALYLNGQYWGIYNLRERIDAGFVRNRVGRGGYDIVKRGSTTPWALVAGDWTEFRRLQHLFEQDQPAAHLLDLDAFIDHWLLNIFAANNDWPHNNMYYFRRREAGAVWRPISWDADNAFQVGEEQLQHDTLAWASRDRVMHHLRDNYRMGLVDRPDLVQATLWLRRLLRAPAFRTRFITRMCDLLNGPLRPERLLAAVDGVVGAVEADITRDLERWGWTRDGYRAHVDSVRRFMRERPALVRGFFRKKFGLGKSLPLDVVREGRGAVRVNGMEAGASWKGEYFAGLTVRLQAEPEKGWTFAGWLPAELGSALEIEVKPGQRVTARFTRP